MNKIAAILTCHNRKEKTLACLHSLFSIISTIDVFLVDDGSTDGTSGYKTLSTSKNYKRFR